MSEPRIVPWRKSASGDIGFDLKYGDVTLCEEVVVGDFTHPRYWFRSLPKRIEIAKRRLCEVAQALDPNAFSDD